MMIAAPSIAPHLARRYDRGFYTGMGIAAAIAVFVGFAPTYYLRPRFVPTPLPAYLLVHGFVFTAWIVLFIVQATLVAARRIDVHRKLGWAVAGLAALMILVGTATAILSGRRDVAAGQKDLALPFLTTPLFSMLVFLILVAAAVLLRRRPEAHKRLMLLATISLLDAPLARWPGGPTIDEVYVLVDLFIVVGIAYDLVSRRRVNAAYVLGGLVIVAGQLLRDVVGATEAWHAIARGMLE